MREWIMGLPMVPDQTGAEPRQSLPAFMFNSVWKARRDLPYPHAQNASGLLSTSRNASPPLSLNAPCKAATITPLICSSVASCLR